VFRMFKSPIISSLVNCETKVKTDYHGLHSNPYRLCMKSVEFLMWCAEGHEHSYQVLGQLVGGDSIVNL